MKKIILSVIIPVYNVEEYLHECIESVMDYPNTEIILVDDGSTDASGRICDSFLKKNVSVIHKSNGGLSDARNTGLRLAKGEYVCFVDSDDYFTDMNMIIDFLSSKKCEILLFDGIGDDYYTHSGLHEDVHYTGIECIESQLKECGDHPTTVWLGVYKREYLLKNDLFFEKSLLHEDELWTHKALINANDVCYIPKKLYFYRQRENSITNSTSKRNLSDLIYIFGKLFEYTDNRLIKANIAKRYLHAAVKFKAWKYPDLKIDKIKIFSNARGYDRLRAFVLLINTKLYCILSEKLK